MNTITIPRLWVLVPGAGFLPAAMGGPNLTAQEWRDRYRARNICTLWLNDLEEWAAKRDARLEARHAEIRNRAA